jgi:DNA polymerase-3 subunit alpha
MGKADLLRRAMGKKEKDILDKEKIPFIEGAIKRGYSKTRAGAIYDMLVPFAGYGFNKSHAAAYSVVAYHTAYLKANFPAEFMAANLTNEIHSANKDKLSECINEARKMGIAIDPPDINRSGKIFTIVNGRIIYGFLGIKGVGDASADEIVRCRNEGPYHDFMDFLARVDIKMVGKATIEKLIQTGACDCFGISRDTLRGNLERAVEYTQKQKEDKKFGQTSLFEDTDEKEYSDFVFEDFPETSRLEKLKIEKQLIGFYFSGHPMDEYRDLWEKAVKVDLGRMTAESPETTEPGTQILVGIIKAIRTINTKNGKMAGVTIADYNGEIEMVFFNKIWESCQDRIKEDELAIVRGRIDYQKNRDKYSFIVEGLIDPREAETAIAEEEALRRKREKFRNAWLYMADLKSGSFLQAQKGSYTVVGQLTNLREWQDGNGNDMAFGTLHDFEGDIDLVFFTKVWCENRDFLSLGEFVALKGSIDPANTRNRKTPSFAVSSILDITALSRSAERKCAAGEQPKIAAAPTYAVHVRLSSEAASCDEGVYPLRDFILENPGPIPVFIHISANALAGEKIIRPDAGISAEANPADCKGIKEAWKEQCK